MLTPSQGLPAAAPPQAQAVVIGSGFGGLAAAVRLGARGYRVTVLEQLDAPGGRGYVHRQDGFTFDAGPTVITAPFLFEELWVLCGRRLADDVDLRPVRLLHPARNRLPRSRRHSPRRRAHRKTHRCRSSQPCGPGTRCSTACWTAAPYRARTRGHP